MTGAQQDGSSSSSMHYLVQCNLVHCYLGTSAEAAGARHEEIRHSEEVVPSLVPKPLIEEQARDDERLRPDDEGRVAVSGALQSVDPL